MRALVLLLALAAVGRAADPPTAPPPRSGTFGVPASGDAWNRFPPPAKPELPEWARALSGPLPKTAARMLVQDHYHRATNPLGARLAADVRHEVADALNSPYGRAAAKADIARAGGEPSPHAKLVLAFARKLTLEGHAITDAEFARVLKALGPKDTTALVHTVAYANFQNRVWLGLGVKGESAPLPPVAVNFDFDAMKPLAPARPSWDDLKRAKGDGIAVRVEWSDKDADRIATALEKQKQRTLRMPIAPPEAFEKLPAAERAQAQRIVWMTVSSGWQPEMGRVWFAGMNAFYEEAKVDRVFTNTTFWVVTRTNDCFY